MRSYLHFRSIVARASAALAVIVAATASAAPEAILLSVGDQHSAYERLPQFVAHVDRIRTENPTVPVAVLINGDAFEYGNAVARRTRGSVDLATFAELARRVPTVLNLGNHEPDVMPLEELISKLRASGVIVVNGNVRSRTRGQPFAEAVARIPLGRHEITVAALTTDSLGAFRAEARPELEIADPVAWARQNLPSHFGGATLPVLLSHAGLRADRQILGFVPAGTLVAGAHDHLQFVHRDGRTVYFQSGSWLAWLSIARLERAGDALQWTVEQIPISDDDPADPKIRQLVKDTLREHLTDAETAVVATSKAPLAPGEAARFAVEAARVAAGADAAVIGGTTFGGGLPKGPVARHVFDACVRFDGPLFVGEIDGASLRALLARSNQGPQTAWSERTGENLVVVGPASASIDPQGRYRIATTDWIARNPAKYLGANVPPLRELPDVHLKAAVLRALQR